MNIPITFKTKVIEDSHGKKYIMCKKTLTRHNCNLKPHEHRLYNSQLFAPCLNSIYRKAIGEYTKCICLDELPPCVTVNTSKFLAVVTVNCIDNIHCR